MGGKKNGGDENGVEKVGGKVKERMWQWSKKNREMKGRRKKVKTIDEMKELKYKKK